MCKLITQYNMIWIIIKVQSRYKVEGVEGRGENKGGFKEEMIFGWRQKSGNGVHHIEQLGQGDRMEKLEKNSTWKTQIHEIVGLCSGNHKWCGISET